MGLGAQSLLQTTRAYQRRARGLRDLAGIQACGATNAHSGPRAPEFVSGGRIVHPPGRGCARRAPIRDARLALVEADNHHSFRRDMALTSHGTPLYTLSAGERRARITHRRDPDLSGLFSLPVRVRQHAKGDVSKQQQISNSVVREQSRTRSFKCLFAHPKGFWI